ncbi:Retrovirus-related Pol polyprotein from transposon TNT 1-94 [Formica fusca]
MARSMSEDIINVEKLTDAENFQIWKFQMSIVFKANELYEVVLQNVAENERTQQWKKRDAVAQKLIVTTLDKKPLLHVLDCNTAREMWIKICNIYERDSEQQRCSLLQTFYSTTYNKNEDIATYISKLRNLAFRLNALDTKLDDKMLISKILATLPEEYRYFASAWESAEQREKTLENLTARLIAEEARNKSKEQEEKAVAFKATDRKCFKCNKTGHLAKKCTKTQTAIEKRQVRCFKCNKIGHMARSCGDNQGSSEQKCSICKKTNHTEKNCYFRNKYNNENKVAFLTGKTIASDTWIVDSGCTSNMTNKEGSILNMKKINSVIGVAKSSETMIAKGHGSIEFDNCRLEEVMYVPELSMNLLSVNAITKKGGEVLFSKNEVEIRHENKTKLKGQKSSNGLFQVDLKAETKQNSYLTENKETNAETWHRKLGHLSYENLRRLTKLCEGLDITPEEIRKQESLCTVCQEAKQARIKFGEQRNKATRPLQIVHTDLCGPIDPTTWDRKRYFLTFLDDYTHLTVAFLLKSKDEVPDKIKEYVEMAEAHWDSRVSKLRCDNGREYINEKVTNWSKTKGIIIDNNVPYSPQLNGKAERLNRTLMEKTRALLFDSGLNKEMWGEALYTSVFLLNRSPTESLKNTPYEMWEKRKPNMKSLQMFGCKAYTKVMGPLKKLDERSRELTFVGYAPTGYRLWNSERRKIIIARDVKFGKLNKKEYSNKEIQRTRLTLRNEDEEEKQQNEIEAEEPEEFEDATEEPEEHENGEPLSQQQEDDEDSDAAHREEEENPMETPRRSARKTKRPDKYGDYVFLTYREAITGPDKNRWMEAINEEKTSLKENNTWEMIDIRKLKSQKPLQGKWVFKIKQDGTYKARLVVKGCEQKYGVNYEETFSPVISTSVLRSLFAIAAMKNYVTMTFDIKTAFLYGILDEDVYMYPPDGYNNKDKVFKLKKALYGLKQAPLKWNIRFTTFLKRKGFKSLESEQCLFTKNNSELILGIYVDDGILMGKNQQEMKQIIKELKSEFKMTVENKPKTFVGFEIIKEERDIKLLQADYITKILKQYNMNNAKPVKIPLLKGEGNETELKNKNYPYREVVGSLLYLSTKTRPDIAYGVNFCSRHVENYTQENINDVKHILKYLKGHTEQGITFLNNGKTIKVR